MSRIRTVKPEFWTSEQVMECSTEARLLFIGLWNFCDDAGRHPMSPKRIKAEIFPGDDFSASDVHRMLDELAENGLIEYYAVDDIEYFQVTGWHHQKIDRPQPAKYPAPSGERSTTDQRTLATEGKGREGNISLSPAPQPPPTGKPRKQPIQTPHPETESHWQRFKQVYPKRKGDNEWKSAREKFDRAIIHDGVDPDLIIAGAARYAEQQRDIGHENTPFIKQASSFMAARTWEEFPAVNGKDATEADWRKRLDFARQRRQWPSPKWGPKPNEPGCLIPPALIRPDDGTGWAEWGEQG